MRHRPMSDPRWWIEEAGLSGMARSFRELMQDTGSVKWAGAGFFAVAGALEEAVTSILFVAMLVFWLAWMVLGVMRAIDRGEQFSLESMFSGAYKLVAAIVMWSVGVTVDQVAMDQGSVGIAGAAFGGFFAAAFLLKAMTVATHFFPGFRAFDDRFIPREWLEEEDDEDEP